MKLWFEFYCLEGCCSFLPSSRFILLVCFHRCQSVIILLHINNQSIFYSICHCWVRVSFKVRRSVMLAQCVLESSHIFQSLLHISLHASLLDISFLLHTPILPVMCRPHPINASHLPQIVCPSCGKVSYIMFALTLSPLKRPLRKFLIMKN